MGASLLPHDSALRFDKPSSHSLEWAGAVQFVPDHAPSLAQQCRAPQWYLGCDPVVGLAYQLGALLTDLDFSARSFQA
jgi:hypothetical protein